MTSRQTGPGIAHPTVVPAGADDDPAEKSDQEGEACPECGRRMPARDR